MATEGFVLKGFPTNISELQEQIDADLMVLDMQTSIDTKVNHARVLNGLLSTLAHYPESEIGALQAVHGDKLDKFKLKLTDIIESFGSGGNGFRPDQIPEIIALLRGCADSLDKLASSPLFVTKDEGMDIDGLKADISTVVEYLESFQV